MPAMVHVAMIMHVAMMMHVAVMSRTPLLDERVPELRAALIAAMESSG